MPGYLAETHGCPVKLSSLDKMAMNGLLRADKYYGNHCLYTPQTADKIAEQLLTDRPVNLRLEPSNA